VSESRPNIVVVAIAGLACLLLIVGAVGTWQVVDVSLGGFTASASATGVEHGADGPIVIGMAVIAGIMLLCYAVVPGQPLWAPIVALVIAGLALLTTVADTIDVADRSFRSPGWGLYLDVGASIALTVACALLVRESVVHGRAVRAARPVAPWPGQQQPIQPAQPAQPVPAAWHPDPWGQKRLRYWDGTQWTGHTAD
jgi:hypothetical protein